MNATTTQHIVHVSKDNEAFKHVPALERTPAYQALHKNLGNNIVMVLGSMTHQNSNIFVTASDLAYEMAHRQRVTLGEREMRDFCNHVSTILAQKNDNLNKSNVHRSNERMPSSHGKMSYGYRVGAAFNIPVRDMDQRFQEKVNNVVMETVQREFDLVFADILSNRTDEQLLNYQALIIRELEGRNMARNIEMERLRAKLKMLTGDEDV